MCHLPSAVDPSRVEVEYLLGVARLLRQDHVPERLPAAQAGDAVQGDLAGQLLWEGEKGRTAAVTFFTCTYFMCFSSKSDEQTFNVTNPLFHMYLINACFSQFLSKTAFQASI